MSMIAAVRAMVKEQKKVKAAAAALDGGVDESADASEDPSAGEAPALPVSLAPGLEEAAAAAARHHREAGDAAIYARRRHWYAAERCAPVALDGVLGESDRARIVAAAARLEAATGAPRRSFRDSTPESTAGHFICYLHAGGFFQREEAPLYERIFAAMVGGVPDDWPLRGRPEDLRVRCIELHTYDAGAGLFLKNHRDNDSVLTLSARLSPPGAHGGGRFVTYDFGRGGAPVAHDPPPGGAVLFPSEKLHSVERVTSGTRLALVVELWREPTNAVDRFK